MEMSRSLSAIVQEQLHDLLMFHLQQQLEGNFRTLHPVR